MDSDSNTLSTLFAIAASGVVKLVKSAHRNRLSDQILEQIMVIKINGPSCEDFPFADALASWQEKLLRRMKTATLTPQEEIEVAQARAPDIRAETLTFSSSSSSSSSSSAAAPCVILLD